MKKISFFILLCSIFVFFSEVIAAQFNFTPRTSFTQLYNDNIYLDANDEETDDFISTVSAGFTVEIAGQTRILQLSYDPAYSFYADNSDNDGFRHIAQLFFENQFTRNSDFTFRNYFIYAQDPLADENVSDDQGNIIVTGDNTRRGNLNTYWRNFNTSRLNYRFGANDLIYAEFVNQILENDDPTQDDSQEFSPSAGLIYWFSNWTGIELESGYTRGLFDQDTSSDFYQVEGQARLNQRLSPRLGLFGQYRHIYREYDKTGINSNEDLQNDYMVYAPSVGGFYDFGDNLTASLGIGYFYQQIKDNEDEQGPYFQSEINKLWTTDRWSARIIGGSGLDNQDFTAESLGFTQYYQIEIVPTYFFTRQLFADARLSYRYSDYINNADNRKDNIYGIGAGLGYSPLRWMTLRLNYNYTNLDSNISTEDYEVNRVFFSITLQPDQPWRLK